MLLYHMYMYMHVYTYMYGALWLAVTVCTVYIIMHVLSIPFQASSSSLDHLQAQSVTVDDKGERRGSVDSRHQRLERKSSGNDRQGHYDKAKRSSLERYGLHACIVCMYMYMYVCVCTYYM